MDCAGVSRLATCSEFSWGAIAGSEVSSEVKS